MLFLIFVLLVGLYLDLEFLDSLDRFSQLSCILKSPLKRKFIEVINLNADFEIFGYISMSKKGIVKHFISVLCKLY